LEEKKKMRRTLMAQMTSVLTVLLLPGLAQAGGGGGHGEPHVANWWGVGAEHSDAPALGLLTITFLIFVGGLIFSVRGPLANFLEARAHDIKAAIEEASRAKADAEAKAAEYEKRLAALDTEIDDLRRDFEKQGEAERTRLEKAGKALAARIAADTEATVQAEVARARQTLQQDAALAAVGLAEKKVRELLAADDEKNLNQGFVQSLKEQG
jgi:F-type H+-transporting ATPase subunit b